MKVLLEALTLGAPSCTYYNIRDVSDIYDGKAILLAEERTDESLAYAI